MPRKPSIIEKSRKAGRKSVTSTTSTPKPRWPYLRVFGPDIGSFEYDLVANLTVIGRSEGSDVRLPHDTVSRAHATIVRSGKEYRVEDAGSNFGTVVNGARIRSHVLRHEDTIQISQYVLQFQAHTIESVATMASEKARRLLRAEFRLLPTSMNLKYRTLECTPPEIFKRGDTLPVGQGGLLVPTKVPPPDNCCLELDLIWPNRQDRRFLGEIMGTITEQGVQWMCVKLHRVKRELHKRIVSGSGVSEWLEVPIAGPKRA